MTRLPRKCRIRQHHRELQATGETVRIHDVTRVIELTAQEAQIPRLVREGLSNPEISPSFSPSPRTVEWHLRKVFTKLDISSRRQLRGACPVAVQRALRILARTAHLLHVLPPVIRR